MPGVGAAIFSGTLNGVSFFLSVLACPLDPPKNVFSPIYEETRRIPQVPQDVGFRRANVMGYSDSSDARDSIVMTDGPSWISKYLGTTNGIAWLIICKGCLIQLQ